MDTQLFNTGSGLSSLDDQHLSRLTVDELIVDSDLQLPNGIVLPVDLVPLQTMRNNINALTNGQVMIKSNTDQFTSIAKDSASTASTLVERGSDGSVTADKIIIDDTSHAVTIDTASLSAARTLTIPDETGTVVTSVNTDFVANNTQRSNINALTDGEYIQKIGTNTFSSKAATSTYSASDSNLVERDSGKIKTNTLQIGTVDGGSSDLNIKTSTGASVSLIGSDNLTLNLNRNGDNFGADGSSDWRVRNGGGNLFFERGNSGLTNAYATILSLPFDNTIQINRRLTGQEIETVPIRMYRQISGGTTNNDYIDIKPDSISGQHTQLFPDLDGTFILDSTTEYVALNSLRSDFNTQTTNNLLFRDGTDSFGNIAYDNAFDTGSLIAQKDSGTLKAVDFLAKQAGNGYMFQSFSNPAVISYLYHSTNSGLGVAVEMPSSSGVLGLTSQIAWNVSSGNITTKGANDNVGIGSPGSFPSRITFAGGIESKICLFDGGLGNMYGFGISSNQLNYHCNTTSDKHVFYAGGTNGNGTQLLEIAGNKNMTLNGSLIIQDTVAGTAKILLEDSTDHDDIDILFRGYNGATLVDNAVIRTENNYLNLETSNTSPMNGIRLSTNSTLAMTIDNNQNVIFQNQVGIGNSPAVGFALDVDGLAIFRGSQSYIGQASYAGSFPAVYSVGLALQNGTFSNDLNTVTLTANRAINFPDQDGTVAVINASGQLQVDELVGTLGGSTKIDLTPGGGNIDIIVPNSAGGLSPNVDINFVTGSDIRMNLNSIDGLVFHDAFIFRNDVGGTYFPLSFNGAVANNLNIGTNTVTMSVADLNMTSGDLNLTNGDLDVASGGVEIGSGNLHMTSGNVYVGSIPASVPIGVQNLYVGHNVTTAGVLGEFGRAMIGNGIADYAMFSHSDNFTTGNYALLQQNDGETFLNCPSTKQIHFRVNNATRGGIDDENGKVRTFFIVPAATKPVYNSSGKIEGDYNSLDNITFRQFTTGGTQNERTHMYSQVVVDSSTTPFTQQGLELQDYGTQPGFVSGSPGFAFRVCDPGRHAQIHCQFSGFTTASNALQTVKLQLYSKQTTGVNAWVDICTFDFYVNLRFNHESFSFSKRAQFTHSYYSFARFVLVSGTFTGDTGDFFHLTIDSLPRLTR